ncbi:MAG: hypothetical protein KC620_27690, partial [Myxococcales bacterium]|nr:hypothetical protein [Myxococcales bacterium]
CDGATDAADADFIRPPCELQEGVCEGTTKPDDLCMGEGGWAPCDDAVYASATEGAYDPELDACDGVDNDCDGTTDAADASLDVVLCENQAGVCAGTTTTAAQCVNGSWLPCSDDVYATQTEGLYGSDANCDGYDNDCDAVADDEFPSEGTSCGVGACASEGVTVCVSGEV